MSTHVIAPLDYYSAHGAALFPIPAGSKEPFGLIPEFSFKRDCSTDPAQWAAWSASFPGCNWGVVGFASMWIIVDIDTSGDRDEAWRLWCELCAAWQIDVVAPHVQSARGGWHVYFQVPAGVDAATLRQPDAIKGRINIRCTGYTVAAGSYYDGTAKSEASGPYVLLSDAPPHAAPAALLSHCTRSARPTASGAALGSRDPGDIAALIAWMAERDAFAAYEDWCGAGMALKLELGDAGRETWALTHDATVTSDVEESKWSSFASEPTPGAQTLNSLLARAHALGWRGTIRKSTMSMFDGVAQLAAAAGASLSGSGGSTAGAMPMMAGQQMLADLSGPILDEFLTATADAPLRPAAADFPTLPDVLSGHGLFAPLKDAAARIVAMSEQPKSFKSSRIINAAAVLALVHPDTCEALARRVEANGCAWPRSRVKLAAAAIEERVQRAFVTNDDWVRDGKNEIEHNNPDNVAVFLGILGCEVRFNAWLERAEIIGDEWSDWTYIDDTVHTKLSMRAGRTKTRFLPGDTFLWKALFAIAHANTVDPALDRLSELASAWDGAPRLHIWLSAACHAPCDAYHQAVGRNVIGGMVRRIREPGCKHDTMPVFFGFQGSSKSTMAAVIADMGKSSLAQIGAASTEWFTDTVRLGDEAKELVLALAGKAVVEIGEMGMRSNKTADDVKAMVSRQIDEGRTAYARTVSKRGRRNVFIGTTNSSEPLSDPTGNRRFLPVRVDREINLEWLHANIGQLIGEAAVRHAQGESFTIPRAVWGVAAEHQEAARGMSDIEVRLEEWFAESPHAASAYITASDLSELCELSGFRQTGMRTTIMRRLGFREVYPYIFGKRTRIWARGVITTPKQVESFTKYQVGKGPDGRVVVRLTAPTSHGVRT